MQAADETKQAENFVAGQLVLIPNQTPNQTLAYYVVKVQSITQIGNVEWVTVGAPFIPQGSKRVTKDKLREVHALLREKFAWKAKLAELSAAKAKVVRWMWNVRHFPPGRWIPSPTLSQAVGQFDYMSFNHKKFGSFLKDIPGLEFSLDGQATPGSFANSHVRLAWSEGPREISFIGGDWGCTVNMDELPWKVSHVNSDVNAGSVQAHTGGIKVGDIVSSVFGHNVVPDNAERIRRHWSEYDTGSVTFIRRQAFHGKYVSGTGHTYIVTRFHIYGANTDDFASIISFTLNDDTCGGSCNAFFVKHNRVMCGTLHTTEGTNAITWLGPASFGGQTWTKTEDICPTVKP